MFITKAKTFLQACLLSFVMCSLFAANAFGQDILRVDKTAGPINDGLTWETAYISLSQALSVAASEGDWEIRVAQGTYHPKNEFNAFRILNKPGQEVGDRIVLLGGFAGLQGANPDLRDSSVYTTILTGDTFGDDEDFGNCLSNQDGWKDPSRLNNSDTVVIVLNCGLGNRIDGFIIEGGNQGQVPNGSIFAHGGGMFIDDSSIDVVNCTFRFNVSGRPENVPVDNGLIGEGGGAYVSGGKLANNEVGFTRFINCTFHDNVSSRGGGLAILNRSNEETPVKVINSLFHDNRALEISGFFLQDIEASGGAMTVIGQSASGNAAFVEVTNCTVVNNFAGDATGGLRVIDVATEFQTLVQNSVFWGNTEVNCNAPDNGSEIKSIGEGTTPSNITVRYSDVEGTLDSSITAENVFSLTPGFVDEANKDFRLQSGSPIVDTGDPNLAIIPIDDLDLDGDNNFAELTPEQDLHRRDIDIDNDGGPSVVDLGAYENLFLGTCCANPVNNGMDHTVNVSDLLVLLAGWGDCTDPCQQSTCPADFNGDCAVNVTDLLMLLASWGDSCSGQGICTFDPSALPDSVASTQFPSLMKFKGKYGAVSDRWSVIGDGRRLASDGFKPTASSSITSVNWWGFYEQDGVDCAGTYSDAFTVTYYDAVTHPNTNKLVPGTAFASFTNLSLFIKIASGDTVENGIPVYFYALNHPAVSVIAGTPYFVEIRNKGGDTDADLGCHWRWPWSEDTTVLYSVEKKDSDTSYLDAGNPENKMSLAFGLNIEMDSIDPSP